jgi:hypothetical protein
MAVVYLLAVLAAAFVAGAYTAVRVLDRDSDGLELARLRAELTDRDVQLRRARNQWSIARHNEKALATDVLRLTRDLREARKVRPS